LKTTNIEDLIRTTDQSGDVMPSFLAGPTTDEAERMGLIEARPLESTVDGMPNFWYRLTTLGLSVKAKLKPETTED